MEKIIEEISSNKNLSDDAVINAYTLLIKLFNNILENPKHEKFRKIKSANKIIKSQLFFDGCSEKVLFENLILSSGFQRTEEGFVLPFSGSLDQLRDCRNLIEAILYSYTESNTCRQDYLNANDENEQNEKSENCAPESVDLLKKKKDNQNSFRRRNEANIVQRAEEELNAIRLQQREKYQQKMSGNLRNSSSSSQNNNTTNNDERQGGFFDFLWGNSTRNEDDEEGRRRRRMERNNRPRMMTLRDVQPPSRQS